MQPNLIDVSYLNTPVNVFLWNAAQINDMMKRTAEGSPSQTLMLQSSQWMLYLAEKIKMQHKNPLILLAIGNLALERTERQHMIQLLQEIDRVEQEAFAIHNQQVPAARPGGWVEVPDQAKS